MPGLLHFLRCFRRAAFRNGGRALAGLVPFGDTAYDIARDAYVEYRKEGPEGNPSPPPPPRSGEGEPGYRASGGVALECVAAVAQTPPEALDVAPPLRSGEGV